MIYKLIMFSEKQQNGEFGWVPKTLYTVSQWGFWMTKNAAVQKRLFGKNWNLACRVILSIYTFNVIFKQIWAWHDSWPSYLKYLLTSRLLSLWVSGIFASLKCTKSSRFIFFIFFFLHYPNGIQETFWNSLKIWRIRCNLQSWTNLAAKKRKKIENPLS